MIPIANFRWHVTKHSGAAGRPEHTDGRTRTKTFTGDDLVTVTGENIFYAFKIKIRHRQNIYRH